MKAMKEMEEDENDPDFHLDTLGEPNLPEEERP